MAAEFGRFLLAKGLNFGGLFVAIKDK